MRHVEDGQPLDYFLSLYLGAGLEAKFHEQLILLDVVPDHAFWSSDLEQLGHV